MSLFIPKTIEQTFEKKNPFPDEERVRRIAERIGLDDVRAEQIYKILELLVLAKRLKNDNLHGDVVCLDTGGKPLKLPFSAVLGAEIVLL